jgi:phenylalanine-4-hydroxylase
LKTIEQTFEIIKNNHPNDWLLAVEMVELLHQNDTAGILPQVLIYLEKLKSNRPEIAHLINGGLELIFEKENA